MPHFEDFPCYCLSFVSHYIIPLHLSFIPPFFPLLPSLFSLLPSLFFPYPLLLILDFLEKKPKQQQTFLLPFFYSTPLNRTTSLSFFHSVFISFISLYFVGRKNGATLPRRATLPSFPSFFPLLQPSQPFYHLLHLFFGSYNVPSLCFVTGKRGQHQPSYQGRRSSASLLRRGAIVDGSYLLFYI